MGIGWRDFVVVAPALRLHEQQEGVRGDSRAVILNLSGVDPIGVE